MGTTERFGAVEQRDLPGKAARRIGQSQALFREVNERISEIARDFGHADGLSILCECATTGCHERIELTHSEYEHLRRMPTRFAVRRGHDIPAAERIVQENERFVTVEKFGESGVAVITLDPRRQRT